jgi:NACalpha-BTF3-like transcription factor
MKFCPNVNSKEYKDLAAIQGDAVAHYLWDTYKGEIPQPFYETKLGSPTQSKNIKPGVEELFESNPELASVGTLEQYSQYLDTIFPDSKVKDILVHISKVSGIEKFRINKNLQGNFINSQVLGSGVYFTTPNNIDYWSMELGLIDDVTGKYLSNRNIYYAIVNSKFPQIFQKNYIEDNDVDSNTDIVLNKSRVNNKVEEYVVKDPDIIHILGNKQDIEGFKKFTQKNIAFSQKPTGLKATGTVNEQRARKWLEQRFPGMSVEFYETAKNIGDDVVHGYVENASMFLWNQAEVGTEYHEAYHIAFRTMLSESQRESLYQEAATEFGEPTKEEISKLAKQFNISNEEARKLALEERMAEQFREYVLTEQASQDNLPGRIKSWFKNLWNWIKAMFSDGVSLRQVYSLVESNNMNKSLLSRKVFRNSEKFKGYNTAFMQMPGMGDTLAAHTLDTIKLHFLETKKNWRNVQPQKENKNLGKIANRRDFDVNLAVGSGTNKGSIANNFVRQLYVTADTGEDVTVGVAIEILEAENNFIKAKEKGFQVNLRNFEVNYDLSDVHRKPYGIFYLQSTNKKETRYEMAVEDRDTVTFVNDIKLLQTINNCHN